MLHRRDLLRGSSLAALGLVSGCATPVRGQRRARRRGIPLDEKLNVGFVGVANRAASNLGGCNSENVVALCDIDENYLGKACESYPEAKRYVDFRRMLEREPLDAVVVSTADHTHAAATLMALEFGLDVYCEKPLTHSVEEARQVAEMTRRMGAVTQMGTQIHAGANYRRVVELVRSGTIGPVRECHAWVGKAWGGGERPTDEPPVPAHLNYDLWLGPAAYRPYHPSYLPANWRRFWDFGGGTLGDMGCHLIDLAFWALELRHPHHVAAEGPPVHSYTAPTSMHATWSFAERPASHTSQEGGLHPAVQLHWHDGGALPAPMENGDVPKWGMGVLFVGEKGMLLADYGRHLLLPEDRYVDFTPPTPWIPNSSGHYREWIDACKTRGQTTCSFDYAGPLTETVLLGNVAYRSGTAFDWNAKTLAASTRDAQAYVAREPRRGWEA